MQNLSPFGAHRAQQTLQRKGRKGVAKDAKAHQLLHCHRVLCASIATFALKRSSRCLAASLIIFLVAAGNEARDILGFDPLPGGEAPLVTPVGRVSEA